MTDDTSLEGSEGESPIGSKSSKLSPPLVTKKPSINDDDDELLESDAEVSTPSGTTPVSSKADIESGETPEDLVEEDEYLPNPGLAEAYQFGAGKPEVTEFGDEIYLRLVEEVNIAPIKRVIRSINESSIDLQYYGIDCRQMKPLAEALRDNNTVRILNLKSNILNLDAMYHLGQMLRQNICIRELILSQCKINAEGIELLGSGLEIFPQLTLLDLSWNDFGDDGMEILALKLCYNTSIKELVLSHNNLTHKSGVFLAESMEENYTLEHLDLSWNQIAEEQGLKKFLNAAAESNESLLSFDLSWNTLTGEKIANIIKNFIGQHRSLQYLNLSHNRFETAAEAIKIAKGINTSPNLKIINLSYNGITADTAFALLSNISNRVKLEVLRLDNVWVKPEFEKLRRELQNQTDMRVIIEGVTGGYDIKGPDMQILLLKRAHHLGYMPKKNKKDFGWFLLRLQQANTLVPVKKAKFEKLVQEDKIKFDEGMVDELAKKFKDENKKVDLNLMLEKYLLLYPDTALPIPKEKKKKKLSKDKKASPTGSPRLSKSGKKSKKSSDKNKKKKEKDSKDEVRKEDITDETEKEIQEIDVVIGIIDEIINEVLKSDTEKQEEHTDETVHEENQDEENTTDVKEGEKDKETTITDKENEDNTMDVKEDTIKEMDKTETGNVNETTEEKSGNVSWKVKGENGEDAESRGESKGENKTVTWDTSIQPSSTTIAEETNMNNPQ